MVTTLEGVERQNALAILYKGLEFGDPDCATALASMEAESLIEVLKSTHLHWSTGMDAAIGLREFTGEGSEQALLDTVEHELHYLVRCNAVNSLMVRWKVTPENKVQREISELIARPNAVQCRGDVMTEEYQENLSESQEFLGHARSEARAGKRRFNNQNSCAVGEEWVEANAMWSADTRGRSHARQMIHRQMNTTV
ncbi:hypothetical protein N431DRAFT_558552 [Stipitochalara longipes BDJ]|nr:hypothetical protein N431DRAFT_558552 [Stipitochalara longipes BDJ]